MSCLAVLPPELLEHIFEFIETPHDALQLALLSRQIYSLALPALYRTIDWTIGTSTHSLASSRGRDFLLLNPHLNRAVETLRISEKDHPRLGDVELPWNWRGAGEAPGRPGMGNVELTWNWRGAREIQGRPRGRRVRDRAFEELLALSSTHTGIISRFVNLQDLTLRSITLPRDLFDTIHSISASLRRLTIRSCRLTSPYPKRLDPSTLRLTDLTLLQLQHESINTMKRTSPRKLKAILRLARSPCLHTLRIDRSLEVGLDSLVAHGVPSSLQSLICDFRGFSPRGRKPLVALLRFLNACYSVRQLALTDINLPVATVDLGDIFKLSPGALPVLTAVTAPLVFIGFLVQGRPLQSVTICDPVNAHPPLMSCADVCAVERNLRSLRESSIALESIQFNLKEWDKEVIYMLSSITPKIKDISISFCFGEIDDDFFMSLGNLIEFPLLERLHLYRFGHCMAEESEEAFEDHKEYLIIWRRYMPRLTEVALTSDVIWVKSDLHRWSRNVIQPMDGVKGLLSY